MEKNLQNILLIAFVSVLVIEGGFIIYQQIEINKLKKGGLPNLQAQEVSEVKNSSYKVAATEKTISENTKEIFGKITVISETFLTVEADIIDFSKLADLTDEDLAKPIDTLPKIKKSFQVLINDKTKFSSKTIGMMLAGDKVKIFTNELIYKTDKLSANMVVFDENSKASATIIRSVTGTIKEINDKFLIVEAKSIDFSKVKETQSSGSKPSLPIDKTYKVFVNDKTKFFNKKFKELKVGDGGAFTSAIAINNTTEFIASDILAPFPPAPQNPPKE